MRRALFIASLSLAAAMPQNVFAAANVLLPDSDSYDSSSAPNLGISAAPAPQEEPSAPPTQPPMSLPKASAVLPATPTTNPTASIPPELLEAMSNGSIPNMSPEQINKLKAAVSAAMSEDKIISKIDPETAKRLPPGAIPTQVLHMPDMSDIMKQGSSHLPYELSISFSNRSLFGASDVQAISSTLGISKGDIAQQCYLSPSGLMQTSKGNYIIGVGLSPSASLRYDGVIKNLIITAKAACVTEGNLPPGSGFIQEMNGRYIVNLQSINCAPPNRQTSGLAITYDGGGVSRCEYQ